MENSFLLYGAIGGFVAIFLLIRFDFARSHCGLGGSSVGRDNWIMRVIKGKMKAMADERRNNPADVCDY